MKMKNNWLNLQLFAGEGTGDGGGQAGGEVAAQTGENTAYPEQERLRELGVPEALIKKRANRSTAKAKAVQTAEEAEKTTEQVAAADTQTTEEKTDNTEIADKMSWDKFMSDPENNKRMQDVVRGRLREAKAAEDNLKKLAPALEVLARSYNLDPANIDYAALSDKISSEDKYYEEKAIAMGTSIETAKKLDMEERQTARQQREDARTLEQQKIGQHIEKLKSQGEALKQIFPNFDLRTELQNPAFARMTSPNVGISVEDAYYAIHRQEIQSAAVQATQRQTAQKISNAIQSGMKRPDENGISGQAASVTTFDYRNASKEQRDALKRRIREASARGEKLYPGQK